MSSKSDSRDDEGIAMEKTEQDPELHVSDEEDVKSYKSIEVRIPSAQMYEEDSDLSS
jgi:hypothetical protein